MSDFSPYGETLFGDPAEPPKQPLAAEFLIPPMTIMNTTIGEWTKRRRAWTSLGIRSELGRDAQASQIGNHETWTRRKADATSNVADAPPLPEWANNGMANVAPGTSIFDPVLTEASYLWFCPPGGIILDPFAGGSVRGVVAGCLGYHYIGIDLRHDQVMANREQVASIPEVQVAPLWIVGDSLDVLGGDHPSRFTADYLFTCPPYADLEVYSDDPADLSHIASGSYADFVDVYRSIIARSVAALRSDRFATIVVGDIRDKKGMYRNFVSDTIAAYMDAGTQLYNEAILVNQVGTGALRAGKQFRSGRKLVKQHQNVLTFVKGDPKKATSAINAPQTIGQMPLGDRAFINECPF